MPFVVSLSNHERLNLKTLPYGGGDIGYLQNPKNRMLSSGRGTVRGSERVRMRWWFYILAAGGAAWLWAAPALAEDPTQARRENTLVLGRISAKPDKQYPKLEAFNAYVVRQLAADTPIRASAVVVAEDIDHMARLLREGKVDYLSETAFTALQLERLQLADIFLHEWKNGVATYATLILARKDGVASIAELRGRRLTFEDPDSMSGFFLAYAYLRNYGLSLHAADDPKLKLDRQAVSYSFAGDETSILAQVVRRHADAGVISNTRWSDKTKIPPAFRRELKVIGQTKPTVRSLMLTRRGIDNGLKERLAAMLLAMPHHPEGKEALKTYFNVDRYQQLSPETLAQIEELRRNLNQHLASLP